MGEHVPVVLPKLGESIHSAVIVNWLKKVGEPVELDEALLEVSTDKVNSEIPAPVAGILREIKVPIDSEVEVGALLAMIETGVHHTSAANLQKPSPSLDQINQNSKPCPLSTLSQSLPEKKETLLSPAVMRLAEIEGINMETLFSIPGTGEGGRLSKRDLEKYLANRSNSSSQRPKELSKPNPASTESEERIQLSGMRKAIAENMVRSFYEAPHASVVMEADVTEVLGLIAREKEAFLQTHGVKLTITSFIIQALTKAVALYPLINASLVEETIIMKRYVNVGLAVHVDGGLLVPVIKHCQDRNLVSIAKATADLSLRAREKRLAPDEVREGTITLTNFGMTGALMGVPIIRFPEVAIVGVGTIQKRVIVKEDDSMAIRHMLYLTLTFDHRVIDGIYGCEFLATLKRNLESVVYQ